MDRFSIIQQQVFNNPVADETSNCGQDQCLCDDNVTTGKQELKKTDLLQHSLITIAAFITAFIMKANTLENIQSSGKTTVILCSPKKDRSNDKLPGDNNNKNSCSHQLLTLCETNNSKRKPFKIHNC